MRTRNWSIRSKITVLLLVPLLALIVLWGFATSLTVPPAVSLLNFRTTTQNVGLPGEVLVTELQRERRLSLVYLGGRAAVLPALDEQRGRTDEAAAAFRRSAGGSAAQDAAGGQGRRRIAEVFDALDRLAAGRTFIDRRDVDRTGALELYNDIVDIAFRMLAPRRDIGDSDLANDSRTLHDLARARELLTREDALVSGAIVGGWFAKGETAQVVQLIGMRRYLYAAAAAELPADSRTAYERLAKDAAVLNLRTMEDQIVGQARDGEAPPVQASQWQRAFETVVGAARDFEVEQGKTVTDRAEPVAVAIVLRLTLAGIVGLIAVVAAVVISVRIGRSLGRRLAGLRREALDLAENRLPGIVARLRQGEEIDMATEAPPLEYGTDEIGQVGRAFTEVQRTAVRSAIDEAETRRGLNEVFLNIARRSQTLVHRQLALFDKMERRATEPQELEDLFQVDHLATRMRRHAEDLVILAGSAPGRGWRHPVPVIDVIRGAISEVEDYVRVAVMPIEDVAVIGPVVGDIIHLLAELIENATSFSPPNTKVRVAGQTVPNGYVIEIEDRGLGMPPEEIVEANDRLSTPPEFDPANSARLGLFVVAKLATRHGIGVQLRSSPYGGVTAVVLVPAALMATGDIEARSLPAGARQTHALTSAPAASTDQAAPATSDDSAVPAGDSDSAVPVESTAAASSAAAGDPGLAVEPVAPATAEGSAGPAVAGDASGATAPAGDSEPAVLVGTVEDGPVGVVSAVSGAGDACAVNRRLRTVPRAGSTHPTTPAPDGTPEPVATPMVRRQPVAISEDGLPRRVRQANLAPQLREPSEPVAETAEVVAARRSPEAVRSRMAALQAGTQRGRMDGTNSGDHPRHPPKAAQPPAVSAPPVRRTDPEEDA